MKEIDIFEKDLCGFNWLNGEKEIINWYWYNDFNPEYPYILNLKKEKEKYVLKILVIDIKKYEKEELLNLNEVLVGYALSWNSLLLSEKIKIIIHDNLCFQVEKVIRDKNLNTIINSL